MKSLFPKSFAAIKKTAFLAALLAGSQCAFAQTANFDGTVQVGVDDTAQRGYISVGGQTSTYGGGLQLLGPGSTLTAQNNASCSIYPYSTSVFWDCTTSYHNAVRLKNWNSNYDFYVEVNGPVALYTTKQSSPGIIGIYSKFDSAPYAEIEVFARDSAGVDSRISSHADPRKVVPEAITSFADPEVKLPFSFQHQNALLGRGEIVDMAKLVKFVEKQMQEELGEEEGKLRYEYDLPESSKIDAETLAKVNKPYFMDALLGNEKWEEVALGADGAIPDEAFVTVEVTKTVVKKVPVVTQKIDFATKKLVETNEISEVNEEVGTGEFTTVLKENYQLRDGKLFRCRPMEEIEKQAEELAQQMVPWVQSRM